jgi:glycosyltransferase involved in cell wall biosynthesis
MVLLSHPTGNANVRNALLALYERNMLEAFYTTVAWNEGSLWNKLLPEGLSRELKRRSYPAIPSSLIHTSELGELARVLSLRLGLRSLSASPDAPLSPNRLNHHVDKLTARAVALHPPAAVYAYTSGALQTFRAARERGVKTLYEMPIAHWRYMRDFLADEAERQPAFAGTLPHLSTTTEAPQREDEELELADHVIVPSRYVLSTLPASIAPSKVRVIPYGAPCTMGGPVHHPRQDGKLRVLYVGALTQRKGLSYLLDAMKKVEGNIDFTIIGSKVGECEPLRESLPKYNWIPTAPNSVVLETMRNHDVLVLPTLVEGFALVVLEAMSQGMTVITTPNSGGLEVIRDGVDGFIVPIRSSEAIAEKIEILAADRDLLYAMSQASVQRALECSWERYRQQLGETVSQVLHTEGDVCHA